jgi:hypothetical protein
MVRTCLTDASDFGGSMRRPWWSDGSAAGGLMIRTDVTIDQREGREMIMMMIGRLRRRDDDYDHHPPPLSPLAPLHAPGVQRAFILPPDGAGECPPTRAAVPLLGSRGRRGWSPNGDDLRRDGREGPSAAAPVPDDATATTAGMERLVGDRPPHYGAHVGSLVMSDAQGSRQEKKLFAVAVHPLNRPHHR